ncbi:M17 family metallopeptidase [Emticicia sp. 21SJ11W-3]|uniref:leucyl aminopeptidase family protein n=1 Tax=Emticicia sp. 21SJ11W-3 TaxID=2916755 RepID=UPI00209FA8C8|nr:leucyl aminopeptidase [Emticicia sp. 21SJ11W-3]UTA68473.1 leucyl aminopeptidase [Emticicia sp. 21SJ11W-3]
MKINISSQLNSPQAIVYPLLDNEELSANLVKIAGEAGLSADALQQDFKAGLKEILPLYTAQKDLQKIYLIGLGKEPKQADFIKVFRSFFYKHKKRLPLAVGIDLNASKLETSIEYIINGVCLAEYEIGVFKTDKKAEADFFSADSELTIVVPEKTVEKARTSAEIGEETAKTQIRIMSLVDAPANIKYPQKMAEYARQAGELYGFDVKVFDEKECESLGLGALVAVGKGSTENPPRFIVLEYNLSALAEKPLRKIGLVGKGVTFDTGGVSIKGSGSMSYMKSDMGGAGAVLGTIELAAKLKLPVHLIGVIPVTENCVDGNALKPSDVINTYSGKTIEVIDTDAEGRIILADGLSYIKKVYEPEVIIDLATLTGNCIAALGYNAAGLLSNNDELAEQLLATGQLSGEKLWRLPLWDDYKDMMKSDIADVKNLSSLPIAGAITAAKFLEIFIDGHSNWAHLDIAGMAFADSEYGSMKSATAYGVRLLTTWLRGL